MIMLVLLKAKASIILKILKKKLILHKFKKKKIMKFTNKIKMMFNILEKKIIKVML